MRGHFIGGRWTAPAGRTIDVINPATEEVIDAVPDATTDEVDRAVAAARGALAAWSDTPVAERVAVLRKLADGFTSQRDTIAATITRDMGSPISESRRVQAWLPPTVTSAYVDLLPGFPFEEKIRNSLVVRTPIGVVGAITPWNYPLNQAVLKVVPALAAGCTVVLKPSEVAPLVIEALCDIATEAGVPDGVLNVVHGTGPSAGEALASHPGVNAVSFTGSTRAGRRVAALAGEGIKKVTLELGGKSPTVVLPDTDDAPFEKAVTVSVRKCYMNSGQSCNALTRLLVPADRHATAVEIAVDAARRQTVGDPLDESTRIGPLVSAAQRDRVRNYIHTGTAQGARLVLGGPQPPPGLDRGFFVQPTVFADVRPDMTIAQEEIFGPVLSIIPYADEDQAVEIANGTPYGLAAAVWSSDKNHATAVARRLRSGQVDVNGGQFNPLAPFGGFGLSGFGREYGPFGLDEFLVPKALQL
jgi:acyl-CoA reductase-like NAD-dependent aldehyde dehydrogenase